MQHRRPHILTILVGGALLILATDASAGDPKAYRCLFETGGVAVYDKGAFRTEKASSLGLEISGIEIDAQTAVLDGPGVAKPIRVVRAVNALHFLEVAAEGFLNVTTVYDRDDAKGAHPAVHSRHFGVLGQPLVSQYTGFCQEK